MLYGTPNLATPSLMTIVGTVVDVVFAAGTASKSFINLFVITKINCLPVFVLGRDSRIKIVTIATGQVGGKRRS